MTTAERDVGDKYVLPTGDKDAARLDVIQEVYGPVSIRALEAAELGDARRPAGRHHGPRFTISLKRSTQNLQLSTRSPAD